MRIVLEKRKSKWIIGVLLAVLFMICCRMSGASLKAGMILTAAIIFATLLRLEIERGPLLKGLYAAAFLLFPVCTFILAQFVQNLSISTIAADCIALNIGICLVVQLILMIIFTNIRMAMTVGLIAPLLLAIANDYVVRFRGNELAPLDFLSFRTAANVAAEYNFIPTAPAVYGMAMAVILLLCLFGLPKLTIARTKHNCLAELCVTAVAVVIVWWGCSYQQPRLWQDYGARFNGYILNFTLQLKDIRVAAPRGYNTGTVEDLESQYVKNESMSASCPDIIVIMNESFADLNVFENELSANVEVTPFVSSMGTDTTRGYMYASVFGGGTANSEYEFLSGNTMAFLPQGSVVYQQFFSENAFSLVSVLKQMGYDCAAMHPYLANGWMRDRVYPAMGFDDTRFLDDFPQQQLIRTYVSDQEMYEYIIDYHEQHDADTPLFLFGVTMQNHGGYTYEGENYEDTVRLQGYSRDYPDVQQYLTLIRESDRAVEYLLEYYASIDRDVVIAFFGDHMPKIENAFYEELNGGPFDTLDQQMRKQMVPFFVWTNYDSEEREVPCSSINYLPVYVLEAAGIPLPPYFQFLQQTEQVIPAINAYGYYSQEHEGFIPLGEASGAEAEAIKAYEILQYNNIFDDKNRSAVFFEP